MQRLLIDGKKILSGSIAISGSKNATLPILAATILNKNTKPSESRKKAQEIFTKSGDALQSASDFINPSIQTTRLASTVRRTPYCTYVYSIAVVYSSYE